MIVVKRNDDAPGDNLIPIADGRKNRFNLPLMIIDNQVGEDLINEANIKKGEVLLSVDFDAVRFSKKLKPKEKPKVNFWIYPGSKSGYNALLKLLPIVKEFQKEKAIGEFDLLYSFPTFYDQIENVPKDDDSKKERLSLCYNKGKYCSMGLLDGIKL